ncbi:MAG: calcium-binding protein [Casimicrobiaceae bacterium]
MFASVDLDLEEYAQHLANPSSAWLYETADFLHRKAVTAIDQQSLDAAGRAQAIIDFDASLIAWMEEERLEIAVEDSVVADEMLAARDNFIRYDLAQALVNRGDLLQPVQLAHANVFGATRVDYASYDRYRDALADAVVDPQFSDIANLLQDTLNRVDTGGNWVAIRSGRITNPFDEPNFTQENDVANAASKEGAVTTFTLYLPYEAGTGGQRVKLTLGGIAADQFEVLRDATPIDIAPDGAFTLTLDEGRRQIAFGLRAAADIDVDETLTLTAQLVDAAGEPTHQSHLEVNLAFDATVETAINPGSTHTGTPQDDNRLQDADHRPVNGDDTSNRVLGLAGRDEVSGHGGDDVVEAGPGNDLADGGDGADAIYADAQLTEAELAAFIASSATALTTAARPARIQIVDSEWLRGGLGDDTVVGGVGNDIIFGGGGRDLLIGGVGHDVIDGDDDYEAADISTVYVEPNYQGDRTNAWFSSVVIHNFAVNVGDAEEVHAGSGNDTVFGLQGDDQIFGDDGDDAVSGDDGADVIFGGRGNDYLIGESGGTLKGGATSIAYGSDYLDGGDGNDTLLGEGRGDVLFGGAGHDYLRGHDGLAGADGLSETAIEDGDDELSGGTGNDTLIGDSGADDLYGGAGNDSLFGDSEQTPVEFHGDDYLDGGADTDYLRGYGGNDILLGGSGNDTLVGEAGQDYLDGDNEDDTLSGGDDADELLGGAGADQIQGGAGDDRADGGIENDRLWGDAGNDRLQGGSGEDYVDGGDGDDRLFGGLDADRLFGLAGDDTLDGGSGGDHVQGGIGDDVLSGGSDDDAILGEQGRDLAHGDAGDDRIAGGDADDQLFGDADDDALWGDAGDDLLAGNSGRNVLLGGAGNDRYVIDGTAVEDVIIDDEGINTVEFAEGIDVTQLRYRRGIDRFGDDRYLVIEGAGGGRTVIARGIDGAVATLRFADGSTQTLADVLTTMAAQPVVAPIKQIDLPSPVMGGTAGDDTLVAALPDQTLYGFEGNDDLRGHRGNDRLEGGPGDDRLAGSAGKDELLGGRGLDTYVYSRGNGQDVVREDLVSPTPTTEIDTLEVGPDILPDAVTLLRDGLDLAVALDQGTTQLRVAGFFATTTLVFNRATGRYETWYADNKIEAIRFADGTTWDAGQIANRVVAGVPNSMTGTAGDDTFVVDNAEDTVSEAANAGTDTIQSAVSYALRANVERLELTGYLNAELKANSGNAISYLTGNSGNNTFNGRGTYFDGSGAPTTIVSGGGVQGYSVMAGGTGDDTYYLFDRVGGQISENVDEGHDTVRLTGADWLDYTLPAHIEDLRSDEGGFSFDPATRYRNGNAADNWIEGFRPGNGSAVGSVIDGKGGADTMIGFSANDVYVVDNVADRIIDYGVFASGAQISRADEVRTNVTYALPDNVENLTLVGSAAIDGFGNELDNRLDGAQNTAANTLRGSVGNDYYRIGLNDVVEEGVGEGIDVVEVNGTGIRTYTPADLPANFEGLALGEDLGAANLTGDARNDLLYGNASANVITGGYGDDELRGNAGSDTLEGGAGDDLLFGGTGGDAFLFSRGFGSD